MGHLAKCDNDRIDIMKKGISLVVLVIFIIVAGVIGAFLAILISTEFQFGAQGFRSERAFYAADSGIARAKQLIKDNNYTDCSWTPLQESYQVPSIGGITLSYTISCDSTDGITISVESSVQEE